MNTEPAPALDDVLSQAVAPGFRARCGSPG